MRKRKSTINITNISHESIKMHFKMNSRGERNMLYIYGDVSILKAIHGQFHLKRFPFNLYT